MTITYLLTVQDSERVDGGLRLSPGISMHQLSEMPEVQKNMMQGSILELKLPGGKRVRTNLVTYGVSVFKGEDGKMYATDHPSRLDINLTVSSDGALSDVPAGTEVWFVNDHAA